MKQNFSTKHWPNERKGNVLRQYCKYCNKRIVYDMNNQKFVASFINIGNECISDEEKIIKDLLE